MIFIANENPSKTGLIGIKTIRLMETFVFETVGV